MQQRKRRGGRPARKLKAGERVPLGLRVTPEIKRQLDAAADRNGRSQSQEAEFRIEQSFKQQELLQDVLELAFGPTLGGLLLLIGATMKDVGVEGAYQETQKLEALPTWFDTPTGYDLAAQAATTILESARPDGTPKTTGLWGTSLGVGTANFVLTVTKAGDATALKGLRKPALAEAASRARAMLGEERAERLKITGALMLLSNNPGAPKAQTNEKEPSQS
jgi:hypothetical protein